MTRFVLYRYTAPTERETVGLSLEAQLDDMRLFLSGVPGAEVIADLVEGGMDDDFGRVMLDRALAEARQTGATLLAARPDRLSRRPAFFRKLAEDDALRLAVACFPQASKVQLLHYLELQAMEQEFRRLQAEQRRALRRTGGEARPALTAAELQRIAAPLLEQGWSLRQIARHLDELGHATRRGGRWQASQVMRMLNRAEADQR
ncbi:MAG: hypothetical protein RIT14_1855 [Pseudomonadota bacterium]|jgi:DNA invertase Pin-like site-specific DNA recombinase